MFLSYYYLAVVQKGLLQAQNDKYWNLVKLLCIYIFAILLYLTTVNQCLTIFFFKNYMSLEMSPLDEAKKKHQTIEKVEI